MYYKLKIIALYKQTYIKMILWPRRTSLGWSQPGLFHRLSLTVTFYVIGTRDDTSLTTFLSLAQDSFFKYLHYIKVTPDPEGRCTTQYSTSGSIWASRVGFNSTKLFWIPRAQIDPRVLYWVKYTDLEGWVLVIHYYTKRDPTNLALLDEMVKIFCSFLSPLESGLLVSTTRD